MEFNKVGKSFQSNGYRKHQIAGTIKLGLNPRPNFKLLIVTNRLFFHHIYQCGTDQIGKLHKKRKVKNVFIASSNISQMLDWPKINWSRLSSNGGFKIPCLCSQYILVKEVTR